MERTNDLIPKIIELHRKREGIAEGQLSQQEANLVVLCLEQFDMLLERKKADTQSEELDLKTLKKLKFVFDIYSDMSSRTLGYSYICRKIEEIELEQKESKSNIPDMWEYEGEGLEQFFLPPDSYYEIRFKANGKWYKGYYEHLWGGSYRAYAWWTKSCNHQKTFEVSDVTEWRYVAKFIF